MGTLPKSNYLRFIIRKQAKPLGTISRRSDLATDTIGKAFRGENISREAGKKLRQSFSVPNLKWTPFVCRSEIWRFCDDNQLTAQQFADLARRQKRIVKKWLNRNQSPDDLIACDLELAKLCFDDLKKSGSF
jgi:hypothetical protein